MISVHSRHHCFAGQVSAERPDQTSKVAAAAHQPESAAQHGQRARLLGRGPRRPRRRRRHTHRDGPPPVLRHPSSAGHFPLHPQCGCSKARRGAAAHRPVWRRASAAGHGHLSGVWGCSLEAAEFHAEPSSTNGTSSRKTQGIVQANAHMPWLSGMFRVWLQLHLCCNRTWSSSTQHTFLSGRPAHTHATERIRCPRRRRTRPSTCSWQTT